MPKVHSIQTQVSQKNNPTNSKTQKTNEQKAKQNNNNTHKKNNNHKQMKKNKNQLNEITIPVKVMFQAHITSLKHKLNKDRNYHKAN
jgi:H+/gluconate symporter-like permease